MPDTTTHDADEAIEKTATVLDRLHALVDELKLELNLAKLDSRDIADEERRIAQDAESGASATLREVQRDAAATLKALRVGFEDLINEAKRAIEAVEAAVTRH